MWVGEQGRGHRARRQRLALGEGGLVLWLGAVAFVTGPPEVCASSAVEFLPRVPPHLSQHWFTGDRMQPKAIWVA